MTADRALVLGTDMLFREWGYVAMSERLGSRPLEHRIAVSEAVAAACPAR